MNAQSFTDTTVTQIEDYAHLWDTQMNEYGLSFCIQFINRQYRTVITSNRKQRKSDIVCTDVKEIVDFSQPSKTLESGWCPSLLDQYISLIYDDIEQENVYFLIGCDEFTLLVDFFSHISDFEEFNKPTKKVIYELIETGKFSNQAKVKRYIHTKILFQCVKQGHFERIDSRTYKINMPY